MNVVRSEEAIVIQVFTSPRLRSTKINSINYYRKKLQENCNLDPKDLLISVMTNTDVDWSFGFGETQYLSGELPKDDKS